MVTPAENDRLTRVGPGTPLGELLRRYWHPVAPVATLDDDPVRKVRILGEDLILYRDRSGTLGLIGPRCGHRLVDLRFGIPAEHGLRCPYHGWCYDESGQCTETPLESPNSRLKERVHIGGYPVRELGGLVFAYLGPDPVPVLPPWDFLVWPNAVRQIGVTVIPCNWLQCHENSADPYHNTYLHGHYFRYALERAGVLDERTPDGEAHRSNTSIRGTDGHDGVVFSRDQFGFRKGIRFSTEKGAKSDSVRWFPYNIFPYMSRGSNGARTQVNMRVPMDDTHTYHLSYVLYHVPGVEAPPQPVVPHYEAPIFDAAGQPIVDYVLAQDMAAWWSQGEITDRSEETLGATDLAVIEFRKIIEEQIIAVEEGRDPLNVYYDPAELGECIELEPPIGRDSQRGDLMVVALNRNQFHKGYYEDDVDRYGPATPLAAELMRRAEELRSGAPVR
ncbi:MAG TPA: Rieske 2Fe-2S domain-containing protein [Acidimicrobiales bacterium]|nr:Rieske 2Fe-2S domain-containing protein [Acidimicrobiales bacterium]